MFIVLSLKIPEEKHKVIEWALYCNTVVLYSYLTEMFRKNGISVDFYLPKQLLLYYYYIFNLFCP